MRPLALALALAFALGAGCLAPPSPPGPPLQQASADGHPAEGGRAWASADTAEIRPGVPIHAPRRDCASNFVFTRPDNTSVFLGSTASCFRDMPVGTLVTVGGPENLGVLVYSSFDAMREAGEQDADARAYNDFAVVRIDEGTRAKVSPSILHYGGPAAMGDAENVTVGARVRAYAGNAIPGPVAWRQGVVTGKAGAWALLAHSAIPATSATTGGPVIGEKGEALGVLVGPTVLPDPGASGVARLDRLMAYAESHQKLYMRLETAEPLPGGPLGVE